jgi:uncharacterized protein (TIGR02444 family)
MARNLAATISPLMTAVPDIPFTDAAASLWNFSLDFYALPDVSAALIELQDRGGLDVNLILFALWHGVSGLGRLDAERLAVADRTVGVIRTEIIEPLRMLRRRLATDTDADIQQLREAIKEIEFCSEKIALGRLAHCAGRHAIDAERAARHSSAEANLALYIGSDRASAAGAVIRKALKGFVQ